MAIGGAAVVVDIVAMVVVAVGISVVSVDGVAIVVSFVVSPNVVDSVVVVHGVGVVFLSVEGS